MKNFTPKPNRMAAIVTRRERDRMSRVLRKLLRDRKAHFDEHLVGDLPMPLSCPQCADYQGYKRGVEEALGQVYPEKKEARQR